MEKAQGAPGCEDEHLELKDISLEEPLAPALPDWGGDTPDETWDPHIAALSLVSKLNTSVGSWWDPARPGAPS